MSQEEVATHDATQVATHEIEDLDEGESVEQTKADNQSDPEQLEKMILSEVDALQKKMVDELGIPPKMKHTPSLKFLCDAFLFYFRNRKDITKEDMDVKSDRKTVDINVALLIANFMEKIIDHASVLYSLNNKQFLDVVRKYELTKVIDDRKVNDDKTIARRAKIINGINKAKHDDMVKMLKK